MTQNRRRFLGLTAGALAGGLAGCTGGDGTPTGNATDTDGDASYTVSMAPTGEVTLDSPPETVAHYFPDYGDMAVALGHGDSIVSMGLPSRFHTDHYDELEGVSVDEESMTPLVGDAGISREVFYELDSDLHMIDPQWLINNGAFKLSEEDVAEVEEEVAPFLGNAIFRRTDGWHDYRYYTLYDAFRKVAEVHGEVDRFEALRSFHDEYVTEIQTDLPAADDRPNALLCFAGGDEPESFYPYRLTDKGSNKKAFRDLGIGDALSGTGIEGLSESDRGTIDYETIMEVDPDSILLRGHEDKSREEFEDTVLAFMKDDDVAGELTAVQNDMVFRGGPIYPGPLHHLFLLERYATGYFPDTFAGELFDRDELASIITE
ncbi:MULTISPECIES: ABC transporter substrate-binding protein [Halolamina]|uniref:Iron complex transport system substrate-binding protein n=1 Tax=Halolamina pelagica TaxID=699431 RepID=A0A1I5NMJ0_9EURY|nr:MULTISPECIES: ABC transporter substrate-binding protein [Halolamina]NHX36391.1 ABC transporter substrate-binding protein [Halolamina sp. R1-12]SFP23025.1 iron complex transport system substrate-binding protein [Halolamina pelagica]